MKKLRTIPAYKLGRGLIVAFLCLMLISYLYPLFWIGMSSFKTQEEIFINSFSLPSNPTFENFMGVWRTGIKNYYINSIFITAASCVVTTAVSALAAFALSRYTFRLRRFWFLFLLCGLMLSPQVSLISNYKILQTLHLYNTYWGLILIYSAFRIPFSMFLMWSYFITLPMDVEEAACLDGCSNLRIFTQIVLPMSKPIMATSILLTARYVWNDFLFCMVYTESASMRTIPYGLYTLRGETRVNWAYLMAGMVLAALPMIVGFILTEKQFVRGLTAGSVKG